MEFSEFNGEIVDEDKAFGPEIDAGATVEFDWNGFGKLFREKREYMEAARQNNVSEDEVLDAVFEDLQMGFDIIFNVVGSNRPEEGLYEKINQDQWRKTDDTAMYSDYRDILWAVTEEVVGEDGGVPSIPGLRQPFLAAVSKSDEHELPPEGTVNDLISEHIDSVRAEQQSREGVSQLKSELEQRGLRPRQAASVAKSMEPYLKSDAELHDEEDH